MHSFMFYDKCGLDDPVAGLQSWIRLAATVVVMALLTYPELKTCSSFLFDTEINMCVEEKVWVFSFVKKKERENSLRGTICTQNVLVFIENVTTRWQCFMRQS